MNKEKEIISILLASIVSVQYTPSELAGKPTMQLIFEFDPENPESREAWTRVCTLLAEEFEAGKSETANGV